MTDETHEDFPVVEFTLKDVKPWWPGDPKVDAMMVPVDNALRKHVPWPSDAFTEIHNRAYEAIYEALGLRGVTS